MTITGIVLAAGAGTRMGAPKALMQTDGQAWVARAASLLFIAGCQRVVVVLGAEADRARALVPDRAEIVVAHDWETGMSASLAAGLAAASGDAALITLVDLPTLPLAVVQRVLGAGRGPRALSQAVFSGRPGHPVLIGSTHWDAVRESVSGDRGARDYLVNYNAAEIECGDLYDGEDQDTPASV